jgi:hypothetical protein
MGCKMNSPAKPGPKSKVTAALVRRVAERVENGVPVKIAIAGERVTIDFYLRYLQEHPKLEAIQEAAKRKFMERAVKSMLSEEKPAASYRWLLEHCHPDLLAHPGDASLPTTAQTVVGLSEELLKRVREHASNAPQQH